MVLTHGDIVESWGSLTGLKQFENRSTFHRDAGRAGASRDAHSIRITPDSILASSIVSAIDFDERYR
jgi:hypothetical protein